MPENTKLTDPYFMNSYCATVFLAKGIYNDFMVHISDKAIPVGNITLTDDKAVNIYYDPISGIAYNDSSDVKLVDDFYFDSRHI